MHSAISGVDRRAVYAGVGNEAQQVAVAAAPLRELLVDVAAHGREGGRSFGRRPVAQPVHPLDELLRLRIRDVAERAKTAAGSGRASSVTKSISVRPEILSTKSAMVRSMRGLIRSLAVGENEGMTRPRYFSCSGGSSSAGTRGGPS